MCSLCEGRSLVSWCKGLSGLLNIAYGVLGIMSMGAFALQDVINGKIQRYFFFATIIIFGLLLFLSSGCRTEHVTRQFGFLDTHLHLAWFHCLSGFMVFDGSLYGLIIAIFHW